MAELDDEDWIPLAGVRRGAVAEDRNSLGLELEDAFGGTHRFRLDFRAYSALVVGLLAVAQTAQRARQEEGLPPPEAEGADEVLLPFPVAGYHLGPTEEGHQIVLRLTTANMLSWDFLLPMAAVERLRDDLDTVLRRSPDTGP